MEMPPPVPAVLAPATVVAIEAAERPGILSMSSRVTVPPDAPPSLSINGTVYSTTSASSIITPAESSAFTKEILFAVIFTPVILRDKAEEYVVRTRLNRLDRVFPVEIGVRSGNLVSVEEDHNARKRKRFVGIEVHHFTLQGTGTYLRRNAAYRQQCGKKKSYWTQHESCVTGHWFSCSKTIEAKYKA